MIRMRAVLRSWKSISRAQFEFCLIQRNVSRLVWIHIPIDQDAVKGRFHVIDAILVVTFVSVIIATWTGYCRVSFFNVFMGHNTIGRFSLHSG